MSKTFVLVTVTYRGDLALFEQLCASIDMHMPEVEHHVLVDRSDLDLFKPFESARRRIIDCSRELQSYREFNLDGRRIWWRWPATIVRGWIYQQLIKIHYVQKLRIDAAVLVDSDAIFIRRIELSDLFKDEAVKLYHCPGKSSGPPDQSAKWHNVAAASLGIEERGYTGADYISTAVIWSPQVVRAMVRRIEDTCKMPWDRVLTRPFRFSEYVLYGVFCDCVEGPHQAMVHPTRDELCHCSWDYEIASESGQRRFVGELKDHHRAVLIQSNLGMPEQERRAILERFGPITTPLGGI